MNAPHRRRTVPSVPTAATRRAGAAALVSVPLIVLGQAGNIHIDRGAAHGAAVALIVAGVAAFVVGLWGVRRRHGDLGLAGRAAFWWFVVSPIPALPFGYAVGLALAVEWMLICALLGVAMLRARLLPAPAVGLFALSPVAALVIAGAMSVADLDAAPYVPALLTPFIAGFLWLGWHLVNEPAFDRLAEGAGRLASA